MGAFVTADEAAARWANLGNFYKLQGHFWLGTGPFYIDKAFPVEGSITLSRYEAYPDLATTWDRFGEPKLAEVEVDGPGQVKIGDEAKFDVFVTFKGEPYASADLSSVKFLVFDGTNALVASGDAEMTAEGQYLVTLSPDVTAKIAAGTNTIEIAVSSKVVAITGVGNLVFVTAP
jgi:peptide/nickel transport system substrate-binding protein